MARFVVIMGEANGPFDGPGEQVRFRFIALTLITFYNTLSPPHGPRIGILKSCSSHRHSRAWETSASTALQFHCGRRRTQLHVASGEGCATTWRPQPRSRPHQWREEGWVKDWSMCEILKRSGESQHEALHPATIATTNAAVWCGVQCQCRLHQQSSDVWHIWHTILHPWRECLATLEIGIVHSFR